MASSASSAQGAQGVPVPEAADDPPAHEEQAQDGQEAPPAQDEQPGPQAREDRPGDIDQAHDNSKVRQRLSLSRLQRLSLERRH